MDRIGVDSSEDEEEKTTKRKEVKEMECIYWRMKFLS